MGDTIGDELEALRRERPKSPSVDEALLTLLKSILSHQPPMSVDDALAAHTTALNAHIDRRVSVYMRGAGEIAP